MALLPVLVVSAVPLPHPMNRVDLRSQGIKGYVLEACSSEEEARFFMGTLVDNEPAFRGKVSVFEVSEPS